MVLRVAPSLRQALVARPLLQPGRALARAVSMSASDAADQMMHTFGGQVTTRREILDGTQVQKLSLTLGRPELWPGLDVSEDPPPDGTPVPPGYHLVHFTPRFVEDDLGPDGTDKSFNPPAPFTRRMWAGGTMAWHGRADAQLRVGQFVEERTRLLSAERKQSRGHDMILVQVSKEFWSPDFDAPLLVDKRNWIFRPEVPTAHETAGEPMLDAIVRGPSTCVDVDTGRNCEPFRQWSAIAGSAAANEKSAAAAAAAAGPYPERRLRWSPTGLFRFSALTFNGHRIHYDGGWARRVEGHPGCVVHGPLNLVAMLDYWRDHCGGGGGGPDELEYRAVAPLYAGDAYSLQAAGPAPDEAGGRWDVSVQRGDTVCMKATIRSRA